MGSLTPRSSIFHECQSGRNSQIISTRPVNGFRSHKNTQFDPTLSEDQILNRLRYMSAIVYPVIHELTRTKQVKDAEAFLRSKPIVTDRFQPGAFAFVSNDVLSQSMEPCLQQGGG